MKKAWQAQLNPQQIKAVTFDSGPLLVLAGAGSGKTRVLTQRAVFLIQEKGLRPENILLVTFTNKAAEEMRRRIQHLLTSNHKLSTMSHLPFAGTFHSFCAKVLRREGHFLGLSPAFVIYDETDQLETIKQALENLQIDARRWSPKSILHIISQAKNELISPSEYAQFARGSFQEVVTKVFITYQKLLRENQSLDFDDLLIFTVKLFQEFPSILNQFHNQFRHILVDEYQDTNKAQYLLTKLLAKHQQLTVVGDASQSIYSWRGANFRNLLNLANDFPSLTTIYLEQNYRSTQIILNAAHAVIKHNRSHPVLKLWTEKKQGEKITLYEAASQRQEAEFIVSEIRKRQCHQPLRFSYNQFAILYRTNAQSRVFEEVFLHHGIPYHLVGGTQFYERKEIKDCLAYLRLLINPKDRVSRKRLEKISKRRLELFLAWQTDLPKRLPPTAELLEQILTVAGYLDRFSPESEQDLARLENIKELGSVAAEFPQLTQFLDNVSLIQQESLPDSATTLQTNHKDAVTLITLHAAKGLEFSTVFLVGMEEGLFPHSRSLLSKEELEEERRLCYVGLTRAKDKLYLTYARRRLWFGSYGSNPVSRFIADLPENLLQFIADFKTHFYLE